MAGEELAACKFCGSDVEILIAQDNGLLKKGEKYLKEHSFFEKPCLNGSGLLLKDNNQELLNKDLWIGFVAH